MEPKIARGGRHQKQKREESQHQHTLDEESKCLDNGTHPRLGEAQQNQKKRAAINYYSHDI
jgi:hypothetical protein